MIASSEPPSEHGTSDQETLSQAVAKVLNAPPTPEQQAKKAARKVRAEERKKHNKPKHGR